MKEVVRLEIVLKKTSELIPYINNTRTHDEKQIKQIAASIKEFGFNNPILIDEKGEIKSPIVGYHTPEQLLPLLK